MKAKEREREVELGGSGKCRQGKKDEKHLSHTESTVGGGRWVESAGCTHCSM